MATLITGATGLLGRALVRSLEGAIVCSRRLEQAQAGAGGGRAVAWDPMAGPLAPETLEGVDSVVHLAGEPLDSGRWTTEKKRRILESRVLGTKNLVASFERLKQRPRVLISTSAVGYYGDRGDELLDEGAERGAGFLSDVCAAWEAEAMRAEALGVRVVRVRIGIVLASEGGALQRMLLPFKLGAGGKIGSGKQWMSWVHVDDVVGMIQFALQHHEIAGALNVVSPNPVTNAEFTAALASACRRPAFMPVPRFGLRAAFGEFADVLFESQRVRPSAALAAGYSFRFSDLRAALADCVRAGNPKTREVSAIHGEPRG